MTRILFIINPISGTGKQKAIEEFVLKKLDKQKFSYELAYTRAPKHATDLAREAAGNNIDIVTAVGGDGTVNEVAKGLTGTNTCLAILPAGSGNGLARHLKIPMNINGSLDLLNMGKVVSIDTASINGEFFVNMAGVGFDAHISHEFSKLNQRGLHGYLRVIFREYPRYQSMNYRITINGKEVIRNAFLISVANGSQYGNNAFIAPGANIQDGQLDICILKKFPLTAVPHLVWQLLNGQINRSKYYEHHTAGELIISQHANVTHLDGEPAKTGKELMVKINPQSLKVLVPAVFLQRP